MTSALNITYKVIAGTAALFIFYLVIQCPCKRILCCHLPQFWIALFVILAVVFLDNGFRFHDARC